MQADTKKTAFKGTFEPLINTLYQIPDEEVENIKTVGDIVKHIEANI